MTVAISVRPPGSVVLESVYTLVDGQNTRALNPFAIDKCTLEDDDLISNPQLINDIENKNPEPGPKATAFGRVSASCDPA